MQLYRKFSQYLKEVYGEKVYRVSVDAGFSCPNIDGTKSDAGCIYCDNASFSMPVKKNISDIDQQIKMGIAFNKKRYSSKKFFIYFQAYSNTYANIDVLKRNYDRIKEYDNIIGIIIATRPDCVDPQILELINSYAKDYEVWVEYGLQSANEKTLEYINRNHNYSDFEKAVLMTKGYPKIKSCAHIILGLPGETKDDMITSAVKIAKLGIDAVKLHPLHIVKNTSLEKIYNSENFNVLSMGEYIDIVISFLELLHKDTVIMRVGADCPKEILIGPDWINQKAAMLNLLETEMKIRETFQGRLFHE